MKRPRPVLLVAVGLALLGAVLASRLELRTAIVELLPSNDRAVRALERTKLRASDLSLLVIGIRSPDRAANLRYAAALTEHLRGLPAGVVELAAYHVRDIQEFFRENRWLYPRVEELEAARDRLRGELLRRKNPLAVGFDEDEDGDGHGKRGGKVGKELAAAVRAQVGFLDRRFPEGYFVREDYAWVATLPAGGMVGENAGGRLIDVVNAFTAAHPPAGFHPQMVVQPAGPVQSALQNREAVERDILSVTVVCTVIIGLSIALFFRSKRWLVMVVTPAGLGTLLAFAVGALVVGYLNSSTAFLGSILLGNGINHAIVLGARYREQRQIHGQPPDLAMTAAVAGVWRSTLAAALAASTAYLSLLLTSFRGFSQFGLIGAAGSLFCWLSTFTLLPALVGVAERRFARAAPDRAPPSPAAVPPRRGPLAALANLVADHPRSVVLAGLVVTVAAALGFRHFVDRPFEYDFRKLSTDSDHDDSYRQFDRNLDALFGTWHSPTMLLADRLDQVEPMRQAIRRQDRPERPFIGRVVTIYDILPGPPAEQQRKLALLADIRKLASDPAVALLSDQDQQTLRENLPPADLRELRPEDLPPLARRPFTERDGTVGRVLLAYHNAPQVSMWNGRDLLGIASVLERLTLADGTTLESSGPPMIFGGMLRSILRDGPLATALSLLGVVLVLALFVRPPSAAALALAGLLVGVFWMVGAAGHLGVRITFLNFIALPITFGIGVEYAVNLVARLQAEPQPGTAVLTTGGAVALCSFTTVVGYGSLLAAHSRALRGFGSLAILGELACLVSALVLLPALASWRARRRPSTAS
jgi:uncharacterized protein